MSLRVLFALHAPADEGTAVYGTTRRRAEYLRRLGWSADLITPADLAGGGSHRLHPLVLPVTLAASGRLARYDVVVFHSYLGWLSQALPRRASRAASVIAFHGLEPMYHAAVAGELARTGERLSARFRLMHCGLMPWLLRGACRRAERVLCLNAREKAYIEAEGWAPASRVTVVANGVERELFRPRSYAARGTRLLFTGQWLRAKGTRYLVHAFERIAASAPDVELTCIGTGAPALAVRGDFPEPLRARVRVLPRVGRAELAAELARADAFVFPSLSEGSSAALLEALASGLPVITTPVGAAGDILADGENAVLVPPGDAGALAEAVERLIPDGTFRQRLGIAAQDLARQFEWDRVNAHFAAEIAAAAGVRA